MSTEISVGTQLSVVKGAPATNDSSGFAALTYTDVGEVQNIPQFGGSREVPTHTPLDTGIVAKYAGSKNYGESSVTIALDNSDSGQGVLEEGFDGSGDGEIHSVKIADTNHTVYFQAYITGFQYNWGDANTVTTIDVTFAITDKVIKVVN